MDRAEKNTLLKKFLKQIVNNQLADNGIDLIKNDIAIAHLAIDEGYASNYEIVDFYFDGYSNVRGDNAYLTEKGHDFLENKKDDVQSLHQEITINGNADGATFGNHNTVNNNFGSTLDEILSFISKLPNEDKIEAEKLIETIKTQDFKPGMLSKFENILSKYPKLTALSGNLLIWIFTNSDKINF